MKIYEICFSPTGGTRKAADILAGELSTEIQNIDLTDSTADFNNISLTQNDISVIAVPSYGGRVPEPAAKRISAIHGNGSRAILMCVYGNRAYEDTLAELQDVAKQADAQDQACLAGFAKQIQAKLSGGDTSEPEILGNRPYKKSGGGGMVPKPTKGCTKCGLCAEKCPVQAIDRTNPGNVNGSACISCMRCVSICPGSARKINGIMLAAVGTMLKKACSVRKDCELYI